MLKIKSALIFLFFTFLALFKTQAQNKDSVLAARYFENENYSRALEEYLKLVPSYKDNADINYKIGYCYLQLNNDKTRAIPYFESAYNKGGYPDEMILNMGQAYMLAYNFEDALTFLQEYRTIIYTKRFELIQNYYEDCLEGKVDYQKKITVGTYGVVDHCIENCESAMELFKNPINVTFENAGAAVNSIYADYNPYVTGNENALYFTSKRAQQNDSTSQQSDENAAIYVSKVRNGEWTKATKLNTQITNAVEQECVFVSRDGQSMIFRSNETNSLGDLFLCNLNNDSLKPNSIGPPINTPSIESQGWISSDENTMIIASNREGGIGETDLYMVKKLPNGLWGLPQNLGSEINSIYNEAFPIFDEKKNTLYFSSEGHTNMGGYDIFSAKWNEENNSFEAPVNMGYPINTPENDMQFTLTDNGRTGYLSALRKEGMGDLDIYKVTFNSIEKRPSVIRGTVSIKEADTLRKEIAAHISIKDILTSKELDSKKVNFQTGRYIFAVENPGKYLLTVKSEGFKDLQQEINLYDKSDYVFEIENNYLLEKTISPEEEARLSKKVDTVQTFTLNKLPTNTIFWGKIKADIPIESNINATIVLKDFLTGQDLYKKNANPKSGKYMFSIYPGKYTLSVTSPGYEPYSENIDTDSISSILATGKNIILQRIFDSPAEKEKAIQKAAAMEQQMLEQNNFSHSNVSTNSAKSDSLNNPIQRNTTNLTSGTFTNQNNLNSQISAIENNSGGENNQDIELKIPKQTDGIKLSNEEKGNINHAAELNPSPSTNKNDILPEGNIPKSEKKNTSSTLEKTTKPENVQKKAPATKPKSAAKKVNTTTKKTATPQKIAAKKKTGSAAKKSNNNSTIQKSKSTKGASKPSTAKKANTNTSKSKTTKNNTHFQ